MQTKSKHQFICQNIINSVKNNSKLLAVLIDPDKIHLNQISFLLEKIKQSPATHIFIGGSLVTNYIIDEICIELKKHTDLPIILFPGDPSQISKYADGILFLNLISGRNPDYLIGHQVNSVSVLKKMNLEIIPTGYILIDGGKETAVQRISNTKPLLNNDIDIIVDTAIAGSWMGNQLVYLEAGSGALNPVSQTIIQQVKTQITVPLLVGGGIRNAKQIDLAYKSGADMVVIGTAFENDPYFFDN